MYKVLSATYRLLCCCIRTAAMLETVAYSLLLVVNIIAMAMVVVGHICTQIIMVVHNIIYKCLSCHGNM